MTELTTTLRPTSLTTVGPSPAPTPAVEEPTLITEQQVLFGTAAVLAGPKEPVRRHHPKTYSYLEDALMAREMHRL